MTVIVFDVVDIPEVLLSKGTQASGHYSSCARGVQSNSAATVR